MNASNKFDINNYQFNKESRDGIYIIHGFTNTTYEVKELAVYLSTQGFYTRADNLPGHATTPEDCNRCRFTDWIEFVEQGIAEMSTYCDNIYLIGISMGSLLALFASAVFPVNAAVYASTVLQFRDKFNVLILTPLFHRLHPYTSKKKMYPKEIQDKIGFFGYDVWPLTALNEMRKLTNKVSEVLPTIKCPALVIHSKADLLSPQINISLVYDSIASDYKEKLIVEKAGHNLFASNPDQQKIYKTIVSFFNRFREK